MGAEGGGERIRYRLVVGVSNPRTMIPGANSPARPVPEANISETTGSMGEQAGDETVWVKAKIVFGERVGGCRTGRVEWS